MIKDKPTITKKKDLIDISHGRRFPLRKNYMSFIAIAFIIVAMLLPSSSDAKYFVIPICLLIAVVVLTAIVGLELRLSHSKYQYYFKIFGFKFGKWKNYKGFSCLVIKSSKKKIVNEFTDEFIEVDVSVRDFKTSELYIMNSSHRKKLMCGSFENYNDAKEFAKEVSEVLGLPIEKFSPKRIERNRR